MLDLDTRIAILRLREEGHGTKAIAKAMGISRNAVKRVLRSGRAEVKAADRPTSLDAHVDKVRGLFVLCKGNLVRVHEKLADAGIEVGYSTLTRFCRAQGLGERKRKRTGRYTFEPGEEMQHDTSPHEVEIGERTRLLQCASVVLCYSRMIYAQCYPRWTRFEARAFLAEAIRYFGGAAETVMIDNSSVIVASGTGPDAVMASEMQAFEKHFGFAFEAHEKGDANRSAHVERSFHTIENNFYPGRDFTDLRDLNAQFRSWCDAKNDRWTRTLQHSPRELFVVEQPALEPVPLYVPDIYATHDRRVDTEGYVNLHTHRYSVPESAIGRRVVVHEHLERVRIFDGHTLLFEHPKVQFGRLKRVTHPDHRYRRRRRPEEPSDEERVLRAASPELGALVDALRKQFGGRALRPVRQLHRLYLDYPTEAVVGAVATALEYGLLDVTRIETIVLQRVAGDFFRLPTHEEAHVGRRSRPADEEPEDEEDPGDPGDDPDKGGA